MNVEQKKLGQTRELISFSGIINELFINQLHIFIARKTSHVDFKMISNFQQNRHFRKVSVNKTFTYVREQNKAI